MNDRRDDRRLRPPSNRMVNFMLLNIPFDQVFIQIRDDAALTWSNKLKGDPNKRPRNKYYRFHWDNRHNTFECYVLKQ